MLEIYFDKRGELAIENLSALLKAFPQYAERATESALRSEGYRLKGLIQAAIRSGGVDGKWPKLNPHTGVLSRRKKGSLKNYKWVWKGKKGSKKRVREYWESKESTRSNPLTKLAGAVRYEYDEALGMVSIGFMQSAGVSAPMVRLARMHAKGYETPITPRLRRMLFALGFPVKKSTTKLKTPARPVIDPIFEQEKGNIMRNIELKFSRSLTRYLSNRAVKKETDTLDLHKVNGQ